MVTLGSLQFVCALDSGDSLGMLITGIIHASRVGIVVLRIDEVSLPTKATASYCRITGLMKVMSKQHQRRWRVRRREGY